MGADGKKLQKRSLSTIVSSPRTKQDDPPYNPSASAPNLVSMSKQDQNDVQTRVYGLSEAIIIDNYDELKSYSRLADATNGLFELAQEKKKEKDFERKLSAVLAAMNELARTPDDARLKLSVLRAMGELFVFHVSLHSTTDAQKIKENIDTLLTQAENIFRLSQDFEILSFIETAFYNLLEIKRPLTYSISQQLNALQNYLNETEIPFLPVEDKLKRMTAILNSNYPHKAEWNIILSFFQMAIIEQYHVNETEKNKYLTDILQNLEKLLSCFKDNETASLDVVIALHNLILIRLSLIKDEDKQSAIKLLKDRMDRLLILASKDAKEELCLSIRSKFLNLLQEPHFTIEELEEFSIGLHHFNNSMAKEFELPVIEHKLDKLMEHFSAFSTRYSKVYPGIEWEKWLLAVKEEIKKQYDTGVIQFDFDSIVQYLDILESRLVRLEKNWKEIELAEREQTIFKEQNQGLNRGDISPAALEYGMTLNENQKRLKANFNEEASILNIIAGLLTVKLCSVSGKTDMDEAITELRMAIDEAIGICFSLKNNRNALKAVREDFLALLQNPQLDKNTILEAAKKLRYLNASIVFGEIRQYRKYLQEVKPDIEWRHIIDQLERDICAKNPQGKEEARNKDIEKVEGYLDALVESFNHRKNPHDIIFEDANHGKRIVNPNCLIDSVVELLQYRMYVINGSTEEVHNAFVEFHKLLEEDAKLIFENNKDEHFLNDIERILFELLKQPKLEVLAIKSVTAELKKIISVEEEKNRKKKSVMDLKKKLIEAVYYPKENPSIEPGKEEPSVESEKKKLSELVDKIGGRFLELINWGHTQEEKIFIHEMIDIFLNWVPEAIQLGIVDLWMEGNFLEPLEKYTKAVRKYEEEMSNANQVHLLKAMVDALNVKMTFMHFIETRHMVPDNEKLKDLQSLIKKISELNSIYNFDEKILANIISKIKLLLLMPIVNEETLAACVRELKEIVSEIAIASERKIETSIQVLEQDIAKKERELSSIEYAIAELKQDRIALEIDLATETQALEQLTLEHDKSSAEQAQKLKILKHNREQKKVALLEKKEELSAVAKQISDEALAFEQKGLEISRQKVKDKTTLEEISDNDKLIKGLEKRYQELQETQAEKERAVVAAEAAIDKQIEAMSKLEKVIESTQKKLDINYEKAAKSERKIKKDVSNLVDQLTSDVNAIIAQHPFLDIKRRSFSWFFRDSQAKKLSEDLEEFKNGLMKLKKQPNIDELNALIEGVIISIESSAIKRHKARSDTLNLFLNNLGRASANGSFEDAKVKNFESSAGLASLRKRNYKIQQYGEMRDLISKATECHNEVERDFNETQKQLRSTFVKAVSEKSIYELQVKEELSDLERKIDQKKRIDQELRGRLMLLGQLEVELAGCKDRHERYKERRTTLEPEIKDLQEAVALIDQEINELQRTLESSTTTFEVMSHGHLSAIHCLDGDLQINHDKLTEKTAAKTSLEAAKKKEEAELRNQVKSLENFNRLSVGLKPEIAKERQAETLIQDTLYSPNSRLGKIKRQHIADEAIKAQDLPMSSKPANVQDPPPSSFGQAAYFQPPPKEKSLFDRFFSVDAVSASLITPS